MLSNRERQAGFTLIELLIVMVIIGILATIAYPAYTGYVEEARRAEAKALLFDAAQTLERCYTATSDYRYRGFDENGDEVECIDFTMQSPKPEFYTIGFEDDSLTATTYTLIATPKGPQSNDECGPLTLDQAGRLIAEGGGDDCW